jgi:hypothetical protein
MLFGMAPGQAPSVSRLPAEQQTAGRHAVRHVSFTISTVNRFISLTLVLYLAMISFHLATASFHFVSRC